MTEDERFTTWILEGLQAVGGSGTPLDVSRQVWARHRTELESAGDLFFTWQIDLHAAADAMLTAGSLQRDATTGAWTLPAGGDRATTAPNPNRWTEQHIDVAVEAYVSMLREVAAGHPVRRSQIIGDVLDSTGRTRVALDAMMSNISAVVQELGLDPLPAHPPRSNVPAGVRPAVHAALS